MVRRQNLEKPNEVAVLEDGDCLEIIVDKLDLLLAPKGLEFVILVGSDDSTCYVKLEGLQLPAALDRSR